MAIVTGREWMSGQAWNCFRADFRRRWRARHFARALAFLLLIGGLQLAMSLGAWRLWALGWAPFNEMILYGMMVFGLYSPLAQAFAGIPRLALPGFQSYLVTLGIIALPLLACQFLMPASAATSVAPDREHRRVSELILAGLAPWQILVAKGLAAVLPFLAAAVAALVATCAVYLRASSPHPAILYWGSLPGYLIMSETALEMAGWLLSAAIQVGISALSRRTVSAVVICYGFQCLLIPTLYLTSDLVWRMARLRGLATGDPDVWELLAPPLTVVPLLAVTLLLLWPRALRALAYQD